MLKEKLQEMVAKSASKVPEQAKAVMAAGTKAVANSIASRQIPAVGDVLPSFELPDSQGLVLKSNDLVNDGQLILTFFRGGW